MNNTAKQPVVNQPKTAPVKQRKVSRQFFTPGEKVLFLVVVLTVCFMCAKLISTQAAIYETNKQIQDMDVKIQEQEKVNHDLEVQISEESTYEKIWERAKAMGLDLSDQNIKVVEPK
ncbi:cell division protein FtsL [Domibacillus sp. A3M-37]|jgi:cell division protein FtsL|uniref:cell division protein FtsL n=1 Tax=Domibacillus TaxID=1433999 RepID=UPI00061806F0|nr:MULTISPECIES: cell division protein FtsL [Domibacillus]MCP3761904.1 cell division protein FtsL [Domibacillus sp. A3M-37]